MVEWHTEHMEKRIIKYVVGPPSNASKKEIWKYKKYSKLSDIIKDIQYDIQHGVQEERVKILFAKIHNDSSFSDLQKDTQSMDRLSELETHLEKLGIIK